MKGRWRKLYRIMKSRRNRITKAAISPTSKYIVTYSQEDKSFVGWSVDNDITYDTYASSPYSKFNELGLDFKVSDEKIIILNKGKFV